MVTMNGMEPLQRLFLRTNEMVQVVDDSFEQHFLWLEEVIAEARQTLASSDLVLLPKTPSAAPGRTRAVLKEVAENLPPPASTQPARRGRLCSKLAIEKIQEQARMNRVKKLRRPSSPITQSLPPSTHKSVHLAVSPSPSRTTEEPDESPAPSCEHDINSSPRSSRGGCQQNIKPKKLSTHQEDTSSPNKFSSSVQIDENSSQEDPVFTQKNDSSPEKVNIISPLRKVSSQQEEDTGSQKDGIHQNISSPQANLSCTAVDITSPHKKSSSEEVVCEPQDTLLKGVSNPKKAAEKVTQEPGASSQNTINATVVTQVLSQDEEEFHLQLDESSDECAPVGHPEEDQDIELVLDSPERQKSKNGSTQSSPLDLEISNTKQTKEDPALLNNPLQLHSIPAPTVTCSKQEAVEIQDISPSSDTFPQSSSAPAPRVTRTKQRAKEAPDASSSSDCHPQSPSVPAPRVTRTKQKVINMQAVVPVSDIFSELPAVPATRITRTKQKASEAEDDVLHPESILQPSAAPAARVTRTKQKTIEAEDARLHPESLPQPPAAPVPRVTRTKQKAVEAEDAVLHPEGLPQFPAVPAPRVTRTKQKAIEKEILPSSPSLPQPAPRVTRTKQKAKEMEPPTSHQETTSRKLAVEDEEEETKSRVIQTSLMHQQKGDGNCPKVSNVKDSGVFSLGVRMDGWRSAESVSSEECSAPPIQPSTPPARITRSKMSKMQQPQHTPEKALPATKNLQRDCGAPRSTVLPQSSCTKSPATRKLAVHADRDGGMEQLTSKVLYSPQRVVHHSPDKTGKVVQARLPLLSSSSGRITPSIISRMQPFISTSSSSSSSSASTEHRRIIKRTVGTPNEGRRPLNIVSGITSFIKSQPARPTREEIEELRIQELQRKKEHEEDTLRKKEQLLLAKTEERKRCNEERMRRAKEARLKREQEAASAKEQQKRERQQREARQREEEEQQRRLRQQQLVKRKAEEEAKKAAKLKEEEEKKKQEEEEKRRKNLEEEKRRQKLEEEARKKLEEDRRKYLAEQRIVLEEQRKKMMKEKEEAEQLKLKESLRILREKELQAKREHEAKAVMSNTNIYKEHTHTTPASTTSTKETGTSHLNTTYTKSGGVSESGGRADSYEMTPAQPKRTSSALNNYNIHDLQSDDSTDDDASPKKKIPQWAMKTQMRAALLQQEHYPPKMDDIFPPRTLLILPDLSQIFPKQKRRFRKRTSSAIWETPPSKFFRVTSPM